MIFAFLPALSFKENIWHPILIRGGKQDHLSLQTPSRLRRLNAKFTHSDVGQMFGMLKINCDVKKYVFPTSLSNNTDFEQFFRHIYWNVFCDIVKFSFNPLTAFIDIV